MSSPKKAESGNQYRAVFTNSAGKATSEAATLTVAIHYHAFAWGQNVYRQLGDGTANALSNVPSTVSGLNFIAAVAAGGRHSLAMLANGTVVSWGSNQFGQLGDGSTKTITVSSPSGTSPLLAADHYTFEGPPSVVKLSVRSGPLAGATSVTITGTEFSATSKVSFGAAGAVKFTVNSPTSITAITPAANAGTVDVTVTNIAGTSAASSKDHFQYTPTVEAVSPNSGPAAGGTSVTVSGTGFNPASGATIFRFATAKATSVVCASSTSCTMVAPAGALGATDVRATVNKATSPVNAPGDRFTYG